ncbi:MAG: hypothetical protein AVDCRST_MAG23-1675 [uncultured Sphingosinicella sp.]|uniref:DUF1499 domain-containing protein n=1 Tax=uncultured Sphingosinicella sp. TaxID=478748 RepID=A0A6J4U644_9SPHN|nr:DUF1499 domain-containing protein [uncultured Sphingosinicella sp.]CAA9539220.1 MAG: hypothetical protein AVDCRST_MAG23-1675 [uncultured Sphingosinicella sp.]
MGEAAALSRMAGRLTGLALLLSLGGVAAALIASVGAGQGAWHFRGAFTVLRYALFAAMAGGLLAIVGVLLARRGGGRGLVRSNLLALAVALIFVLYLGNQIATARSVPAIHDVTTNLADLPRFDTLKVRADNLENVPDNDDPKLKVLDAESRWKAIHRQAYGDLRPLRLNMSVPDVIARAEALARTRGWEIARADRQAGILEATDTTFFFRFKDDVVLRARPHPVKGGTEVDMRSISRVGGSDVGVNAKRIRAFLKDLEQG